MTVIHNGDFENATLVAESDLLEGTLKPVPALTEVAVAFPEAVFADGDEAALEDVYYLQLVVEDDAGNQVRAGLMDLHSEDGIIQYISNK